ncbi:zonadhesin-like isoform X2 [Styela clava]
MASILLSLCLTTLVFVTASCLSVDTYIPPCEITGCPPYKQCVDGECIDLITIGPPPAVCWPRCRPWEYCRIGRCVRRSTSCAAVLCMAGQICIDGRCVDSDTCSSPCAPGQVCEDGRCVCRIGDFHNGRCVTCPPGKIFRACPSNCPPTCEKPFPQACTLECNLDRFCVCPDGLLEHNGGCVKRDQCPNKCPANKIPVPCATICQPNCDDPNPFGLCLGVCNKEDPCVCREGYIERSRNDDTCIRKEHCHGKCPANKIPVACATICQPNCDDPNPIGICLGVCNKEDPCVCREGYIERSRNDVTCIRKEHCPGECHANKIAVPCATICQPNCDDPNPIGICLGVCNKEDPCVCREGYIEKSRNDDTCIRKEHCSGECGFAQKPTTCASFCPPTCQNPGPSICVDACDPSKKCVCREGYVQVSNHDTRCTLLRNCPRPHPCDTKKCPPGSVCIDGKCQCRRRCPPNEHCLNGICECLPGHYRKKGVCVPYKTCPIYCPPNSICENGRCVCEKGYEWRGNKCVEKCRKQICGDHGECRNGKCVCFKGYELDKSGKCVDICRRMLCGPNEICHAGECRHSCALIFCGPGTTCINGKCVCKNRGHSLVAGHCIKQCRPRCKPGWKCVSGVCVCVGIYCPYR